MNSREESEKTVKVTVPENQVICSFHLSLLKDDFIIVFNVCLKVLFFNSYIFS